MSFNNLNTIEKITFQKLIHLNILDLSNNKIQDLDLSNNKTQNLNHPSSFTRLTSLNLSNNQISSLKIENFVSLHYMKYLDISSNQINELGLKGLFSGLKGLKFLNLNRNQIEKIDPDTFSSLKYLEDLNLSGNNISQLDKDLFVSLVELTDLDLSFNQLKSLPDNLISRLKNLKLLKINNNKITKLPSNLFSISKMLDIDSSSNQITILPLEKFESGNINLSNNKIKRLPISFYDHLIHIISKTSEKFVLDFRSNFNLKNDSYFDNFYKIKKLSNFSNSDKIRYFKTLGIYELDYYFNKEYKDTILAQYDDYFLVSTDTHLFSKVLSVYLNKLIINAADQSSLYSVIEINKDVNKHVESKGIILENSLQSYFDRLNEHKISVLDFFCYFTKEILPNNVLLYLEDKISNLSKEYVTNLEFKFFSNESIYCLCVRNDIKLFKKYFPISNPNEKSVQFDKDHKINQFIFVEDGNFEKFWLDIKNFDKIFEVLLSNRNERIAQYLIEIFSIIYEINMKNESLKDSFRLLSKSFRKKLKEIFEKKWYRLINFVLDHSEKGTHFLLENNEETNEPNQFLNIFCKLNRVHPDPSSKKEKNNSYNNFSNIEELKVASTSDQSKSKDKIQKDKDLVDKIQAYFNEDIVYLIRNSNNEKLLDHKTTKYLLNEKWKYTPCYTYYFNLLVYILFLVFYSIIIEDFRSGHRKNYMEITAILISVYFLITEVIQFVISLLLNKNIFYYIYSIKNTVEVLNCISSILGLSLLFQTDLSSMSYDIYATYQLKSSLYSLSIISSYFVLLMKLDKFSLIKFGRFVNLFRSVFSRSFTLLLILIILLIGFLVSFRNRSTSISFVENSNSGSLKSYTEILFFNTSSTLSLFKLITMTVGQISTDDMGVDDFSLEDIANYLIYIFFIYFMCLLVQNLFTSVAFDELNRQLKDSKIQMICAKIDYVKNFDHFRLYSDNKILSYGFIEKLMKKIIDGKSLIFKETGKHLRISFIWTYLKNSYNEYKIDCEKKEEIKKKIIQDIRRK